MRVFHRVRKADNFLYLLAAMVFLIVVSPVIDYVWPWADSDLRPQGIVFAITLLVAVFSMHENRAVLGLGIALVVATFASAAVAATKPQGVWDFVSAGCFLLYLLMALWICVAQLLQDFHISFNQLVGAICVYLLLGTAWSVVYAMWYALDPTAFVAVGEEVGVLTSHDWIYFSFVTLTTLGYGDIVPVAQGVKTLAIIQAIVGQFYLAILVAGLVSAYLAERRYGQG